MELSLRELMQFGAIFISLIGGVFTARLTIKALVQKVEALEEINKDQDIRLDKSESIDAVMASRLAVLTEINSVANLEKRNRELADMAATIKMYDREIENLRHMHNSIHPRTDT
jgi:hypothetical protein